MERILGSLQNLWEGQRDRLRAWMRTKDAGQCRSSQFCPGLRTLGSLWHNQGWVLNDDRAADGTLKSGHGDCSCCYPMGKESSRHSLCGLWFRVQGSALYWPRPDYMSKLCRWKSLESKCLAFSGSIVKGEQWALTSANTQDEVFHTFCSWAAEIWQMSSITSAFKFCSIIWASLVDLVISKSLKNTGPVLLCPL